MDIIKGVAHLFFIILYSLLPVIIPMIIIVIGIVIKDYYLEKNYKNIIKILVGVILVVILVFQSDFIKSRKIVDKEWMIGKTEFVVKLRYSGNNHDKIYKDIVQKDNNEYHYCVREIFEWDAFDDIIYGELVFYVLTDDNDRIIDVICYQWGGTIPYSDYKYSKRW